MRLLFYGLALLLAYFVYLIFAPFLVPLAWAAVLVVVSYPAYEWLTRRMHPTSAALVCTLGVTLILIVPSVLVMIAFVRQGVEAVQSIQFSIAAGHFTWLADAWTHLHNRFPSIWLGRSDHRRSTVTRPAGGGIRGWRGLARSSRTRPSFSFISS